MHYQDLSIHTVKLDNKQTVTFQQRRRGRKLKPTCIIMFWYVFIYFYNKFGEELTVADFPIMFERTFFSTVQTDKKG